MKNKYLVGLVLVLAFSLFVCGCGSRKGGKSSSQTQKTIITITDGKDKSVEVACPVDKVISITSGASEIICALGAEEKIVGRDSYSVFPASLKKVPVMAESSYTPNPELIIESNPDVVVADSMLQDDMREKLEAAGIPVLIYSTSEPEKLPSIIEDLGTILGKKERAQQMIDFSNKYYQIIEERIAKIAEEDKPHVYYEWSKPYFSVSAKGPSHKRIVDAGGINIAADEPVPSPTLTPEWLAEKDPEIIVRMGSRDEDTVEQMKELRQEVMSRPGLIKTKAVHTDKVYVMKWGVGLGVRSVVGSLYFAKWFHPEIFADIDPKAVHKELLKKFYNLELEETYVYPENS